MCGIFGYYFVNVSKRRGAVLETLLRGLRRLEYRGYDSAGICLETSEGPVVIKSVGKIDELDRMVYARIPADELQQVSVPSLWLHRHMAGAQRTGNECPGCPDGRRRSWTAATATRPSRTRGGPPTVHRVR